MTQALHLTLQQLRIFEAVARHQSYTRAAEALHLTQPAVSTQIRKLEESTGVALFEVLGRRVHLTEAGQVMRDAATDVLDRIETLREEIDSLRGEVTGTLRVTAVGSANYFVPHLLGAFLARYPLVQPSLTITNRASVLQALTRNEGDVFVTGRVPRDVPVVSHTILENRVALVGPPDHALVGRAAIPLEEVARERMLLREKGSGTRHAVETLMGQSGHTLSPYMELGSDEAIKQAVMAGLGIAALPQHSLRVEIDAGLIAPLNAEGFPLIRHWYAVHLAGKRLSRAASAFVSLVEDSGEALLADHRVWSGVGV